MKKEFKITFDYDEKLSDELEELLKRNGYIFVGSGYNTLTKQRDLHYEKNKLETEI